MEKKSMSFVVVDENQLKSWIREALEEHELISAEDSNEEPISQRKAAEYLGVSQPTIIRWKKQGMIPYQQVKGSSRVRFYKSQLRAVLRRNSHLLQAARK